MKFWTITLSQGGFIVYFYVNNKTKATRVEFDKDAKIIGIMSLDEVRLVSFFDGELEVWSAQTGNYFIPISRIRKNNGEKEYVG